MTASVFSLDRRLDVFAAADLNPVNNDHKLERIVSFDNGETWVDNWIRNDIGVFTSSAAASITGDSLDTFVAAKGKDNRIWFTRLEEYYDFSNKGWGPIGQGVFTGKPAICCSGNSISEWNAASPNNIATSYSGVKVMVFGKGNDKGIWWAFSSNGGSSWDMAWKEIGNGQFTSSPAAACSADGNRIYVFGKGMDNKMWWAFSSNGGSSWDMAWQPIGVGVFTSAPAAVCSADGNRIYVFARGNDNKFWWAFSTNGGASWDMAWESIGVGVFTSLPSASCSWDGKIIHVFGKGNDNRIWHARSNNFGSSWDIAWRKIHSKQFESIDL